MKIRIKFSKTGDMRFIGHLDLMRCFQKIFRRSGIDIRFSEGLSPHMIMSFASPLGVGLTSEGEYVDIEIGSAVTSEDALLMLNNQAPEGIRFLEFVQVEPGKASKAMSLVDAADYEARLEEIPVFPEEWIKNAAAFKAQPSIMVDKETKSGVTRTDIAPMIHVFEVREDERGSLFFMRLASGSSANLKPELVFDAFRENFDLPVSSSDLLICRKELYTRLPGGSFASLGSLGRMITKEDLA